MSNIKKPEPLTIYAETYETMARVARREDREPSVSPSSVAFDIRNNMIPAVEAYAAERVREALEQAAQEANDWAIQYVEVDSSPHRVGDYIRALITKE